LNQSDKNEALMEAVSFHNVKVVQELLEDGADPNYTRVYNTEEPQNQPTTPLRMVMFCISDNLLEEDDLKQFAEVAKLLLQHGGDPKPAMQLAEMRYGKYDPHIEESTFMNVWHIVAKANLKLGEV
jgi:ankyrin repeat protein